jgi:hypothetical protein
MKCTSEVKTILLCCNISPPILLEDRLFGITSGMHKVNKVTHAETYFQRELVLSGR